MNPSPSTPPPPAAGVPPTLPESDTPQLARHLSSASTATQRAAFRLSAATLVADPASDPTLAPVAAVGDGASLAAIAESDASLRAASIDLAELDAALEAVAAAADADTTAAPRALDDDGDIEMLGDPSPYVSRRASMTVASPRAATAPVGPSPPASSHLARLRAWLGGSGNPVTREPSSASITPDGTGALTPTSPPSLLPEYNEVPSKPPSYHHVQEEEARESFEMHLTEPVPAIVTLGLCGGCLGWTSAPRVASLRYASLVYLLFNVLYTLTLAAFEILLMRDMTQVLRLPATPDGRTELDMDALPLLHLVLDALWCPCSLLAFVFLSQEVIIGFVISTYLLYFCAGCEFLLLAIQWSHHGTTTPRTGDQPNPRGERAVAAVLTARAAVAAVHLLGTWLAYWTARFIPRSLDAVPVVVPVTRTNTGTRHARYQYPTAWRRDQREREREAAQRRQQQPPTASEIRAEQDAEEERARAQAAAAVNGTAVDATAAWAWHMG
ncbi:hypothetical protein H9P43_005261 [Blastocladiella emersonii ATCC 22665]|nr:hypothetical protein H9P43_005261 [Blastocladiella emersonii ATCC 22665]